MAPSDRSNVGPKALRRSYRGTSMAKGTVKWFNATKGYGFITPDNGDKDAFVHISEVERSGMGQIVEGQRVSFEVKQDARGLKAINLSAGE